MHKNVFTLPVSFTGSHIEDEPNFPQRKKTNFTENCVRCRQGSEFQGLFKTL